MSDRVTLSITQGVADVRLNRPDKRNALDQDMFAALLATGAELRNTPSVRAVVLSGEGAGFCAGLDFSSFMAMSGDAPPPKTKSKTSKALFDKSSSSPANAAQAAAYTWVELPVPVIAAVHGAALGGGFQIALGADIRIVAPDAKLSVMEIKWGLVPDMSISQTLLRLVPIDVAKELTYTGRVFSGSEAKELGLATQLSDTPYETALELAKVIATKSPLAIRAAKQLYDTAPNLSPADGLKLEETLQRGLIGSPNQIEAVQANMQKRDPVFKDPE